MVTYARRCMSQDNHASSEGDIPWQSNLCQQLPYPSGDFNILSQSVRLCIADDTSVAHLPQQLRDYIVVALNLYRQQRRSQKIFQDIDDAVQEFEHRKWLRIGSAGT